MFQALLAPAICAALISAPPGPGSRGPARTVQLQIEAFNAHDLEAFAGTFADDLESFDFPSTRQGPQGRAALKEVYAKRFKDSVDLHVSVKDQMVSGAFVVQRERITGRGEGKAPLEVVVIYQVEEGLIRKFWSIR
jgi:hypothetical protein